MVCQHWEKSVIKNFNNVLIHKDECIRCFHTPKSAKGLDVCLTCLQGSCSEDYHGTTHQQIHYNMNKSHCITMNIKMTLKPKEQREQKKIERLAIGVPGGLDPEQDNYDRTVVVHCYACEVDLPLQDQKIQALVNSILEAKSAFDQEKTKEWELELKECHHTKNLDQSNAQYIAEQSMAHCAECDLKNNLWLCMTCGYLGCGRKNFDGTGGNGHAAAHFQHSQHPLVCKLGTITPEGTASIFCYACGEDVIDSSLGTHLQKLGIQIRNQKKTEKTMAELDLELNLSFTLSKVLEEGKILIPVFGQDKTGMINLGNTCYMNSVVQVLFSLPAFKQYYLQRAKDHLLTCHDKNACNDYLTQFSKLAEGLYSGAFSRPILAEKTEDNQKDEYYQEGIRPQMFKCLVGKDHEDFKTGQQQDAREYFSHILEVMQKGERQIHGSDPTKAFEFEFETTLICQECQSYKKKVQKESLLNLQVPVSSKVEAGTVVDLETCLLSQFSGGLVDQVNCTFCSKKTVMLEQKRFKTFPKYLVVVLQRFVVDNWVPKKLEIDLKFDHSANHDFLRFAKPVETFGNPMPDPVEQQEWVEPNLPMEIVHELMNMGIPENQAKHSVFNCGANASAEMAVMWFYENIENPAIQVPLLVKKQAVKKEKEVDPESIMMIESMGFSSKQAKRALRKCDGNLERACDWIFSHIDEPDSDDQMQIDFSQAENESIFVTDKPDQGNFLLHGFITHLGASVHAGHYVAHIKKDDDWVYFNDAKVASSTEPPFGKAYVYVFKQI